MSDLTKCRELLQRYLMTQSTNLENYISAKDAALMLNAVYQNNFAVIDRVFLENNFSIAAGDTANTGMAVTGGNYETFLNLNGITETRYNEVGLFCQGGQTVLVAVLTANGRSEHSVPMVQNFAGYVVPALM